MKLIDKLVNQLTTSLKEADIQDIPSQIPSSRPSSLTEFGKKVGIYAKKRGKPLSWMEKMLILEEMGKLGGTGLRLKSTIKSPLSEIKNINLDAQQQPQEEIPLAASVQNSGKLMSEVDMSGMGMDIGDPSGRTPVMGIAQTSEFLIDAFNSPKTVAFIWGAPGVGKTALVNTIGLANNVDVVTVVLSQLTAQDFSGLPAQAWIEVTGVFETESGEYEFGTQSFAKTTFAPPAFFPDDNGLYNQGGIIFFDELNTADQEVFAACLTLLSGRHTAGFKRLDPSREKGVVIRQGQSAPITQIGYKLPSMWRVWGAGNRSEEVGDLVNEMALSLRRRLKQVTLVTRPDEWEKYFQSKLSKENPKAAARDRLKALGIKLPYQDTDEFDPSKPLGKGYKWKEIPGGKEGEKRKIIEPEKVSGYRSDVFGFISSKPGMLSKMKSKDVESEVGTYLSPAGWDELGEFLNRMEQTRDRKLKLPEILTAAQTFVGPEGAVDFVNFTMLSRMFPQEEIENIYKNPKKAALLPTNKEKLISEDEILSEIGTDVSDQDTSDAINSMKAALKNKQEYTRAKSLDELVKKGIISSPKETPQYRPDVMFAVASELADKLNEKLTPEAYDNIINYAIKLNNETAAMALLGHVISRNPAFATTYKDQRRKSLKKLFGHYTGLQMRTVGLTGDIKKSFETEFLTDIPSGTKKEHAAVTARDMINLWESKMNDFK